MTLEEKKALSESLEKKLGCSLSTFAELLREHFIDAGVDNILSNNDSAKSAKDEQVQITLLMHNLGVPAHLIGHKYLVEAIFISFHNPIIMHRMTKELYPIIATKFGTTPSRVERGIRHAIEVSWGRGDAKLVKDIFSNTISTSKSKPTNSEFISMISQYFELHR